MFCGFQGERNMNRYVWGWLAFLLPTFVLQASMLSPYNPNDPYRGQVNMRGVVLVDGCSIALEDRYQAVSLGEHPLQEMHKNGHPAAQPLRIRLRDCVTATQLDKRGNNRPALRVRFDGLRDVNTRDFGLSGSARGVALQLRDTDNNVVFPGQYQAAIYDRSYNEQLLNYQLALVPNGDQLLAGDYSAVLRFNVEYQ